MMLNMKKFVGFLISYAILYKEKNVSNGAEKINWTEWKSSREKEEENLGRNEMIIYKWNIKSV